MSFDRRIFRILIKYFISFIITLVLVCFIDYFVVYQFLSLKEPYSLFQTFYIAFGIFLFQIIIGIEFIRTVKFKWYVYLILIFLIIVTVEVISRSHT
jgi:hypothetical protein